MNYRSILSANLKQFRKSAVLSQEVLAERCALSSRCYGDIERGVTNISLDTLSRLATATNCTPAQLLTEGFF